VLAMNGARRTGNKKRRGKTGDTNVRIVREGVERWVEVVREGEMKSFNTIRVYEGRGRKVFKLG